MGNVVAVRVKAGDPVKAGDVLVEIDPQTARGQESQAKGALAQARAGLALAERNFQRFEALARTSAASDLELDMARMQYEQAKGAAEQGKGAVEAASSVAQESRVVAPFAGRVTARLVEAGDFAAPGRPVATIESSTGRRLVLSVPESGVHEAGLSRGMKVPVSIDALAGHEISGTVAELTPGADPMSHAFTLKLDLEGDGIATGLSGRAWIDAGTRKAVVIPRSAVVAQGGVSMVVTRDAAGKARSRAVTLGGEAGDGRVEVLAGLEGSETVLTGLLSAPADGTPVTEVSK
jgi:RND family efflux transporter MFP subunit